MAILKLESLVLRGVAVRKGGLAVDPRLGSDEAVSRARAIPITMRHPSHGCTPDEPTTAGRSFAGSDPDANTNASRAGRSAVGSRAGVLGRRSPAIKAGRTAALRWSRTAGVSRPATAGRLRLMRAKQPAVAADANASRRPTPREVFKPAQAGRFAGAPAGYQPAAPRTRFAASTRGRV